MCIIYYIFNECLTLSMSVISTNAMWSRKQSVCSAVSGASNCDEQDAPFTEQQIYPFAIALRIRVLQRVLMSCRTKRSDEQRLAVLYWPFKKDLKGFPILIDNFASNIVCGIGGVVVGAVGWLEEREKPALGLGVPAGAVTFLAAVTSVYFSRGFGGWVPASSRSTKSWGAPWRAFGPSPSAAIPLTILWTIAITAHIAMLAFSLRSLLRLGCGSRTCVGVAAAQLSVSISTLVAALFMLQMDLRYDPSLSPPRQSDTNTCTGVSMVPLNSVAINSGNSGEEGSPLSKEREHPTDPNT